MRSVFPYRSCWARWGATLLAALLRWPIGRPGPALVLPMRVALGVLIGSTITPDLVQDVGALLGAVVCVPLYVVLSSALGMFYYRRIAGFSPDESYFAGLPGGLYAMTAFAEDAGVGIRRVAVCHTIRITLVVILVPIGIEHILGSDISPGASFATASLSDTPFRELGLLAIAGLLGVLLGRATRLVGGLIIGPMLVSAVFQITGLSAAKPPQEIFVVAQVVLGASIGAHFLGEDLANVRRAARYTLLHVALTLFLTVLFAAFLASVLHIPVVTSIIGFAPVAW